MNSTPTGVALFLPMLLAFSGADAPNVDAGREEKPLEVWITMLQDEDAAHRAEAAREIGRRGPQAEQAVPALVAVLDDGDPTVRGEAAFALGKIGPPAGAAVPSLIRLLDDETTTSTQAPIWLLASFALGRIGPEAVPELIKVLDSPRKSAYRGAVAALLWTGPAIKDAVPALIRLMEREEGKTRRVAMAGLMGAGPDAKAAVPSLIRFLSDDDFHTQYTACITLARIGPPAISAAPRLCELLSEGATSVRRHAASALGHLGPDIGEEAIDLLIAALEDQSQAVREDAVIALGTLGPPARRAVPAIKKGLEERTIAARVAAARALWLLTGETDVAVPVLIGELSNYGTILDAAEALGELGPAAKQAVPALAELLESEDEETRQRAGEALDKINAPATDPSGSGPTLRDQPSAGARPGAGEDR